MTDGVVFRCVRCKRKISAVAQRLNSGLCRRCLRRQLAAEALGIARRKKR